MLDDPEAMAAIRDSVAASPLVLADGHHRYETARTYHRQVEEAGAEPVGRPETRPGPTWS